MTDRTIPSYVRVPPARRGSLVSALLRFDARFRQRRSLERLDARQLRDLGLGEADVARETGTPFWDAPAWWR